MDNQKRFVRLAWRESKRVRRFQRRQRRDRMRYLDEYSQMSAKSAKPVAFLSKKSDTFDALQALFALMENETGMRIHSLRTDGGGEYTSEEVQSWLRKKGISHEKTNPLFVIPRATSCYIDPIPCQLSFGKRQFVTQLWPQTKSLHAPCLWLQSLGTCSSSLSQETSLGSHEATCD